MGGEKAVRLFCIPSRLGSPPRRRGKGGWVKRRLSCTRITPAWAGKRKQACFLFRHSRDHPRVGGEKADIDDDGLHYKGSPPRGRGKAFVIPVHCFPPGITPAWAGKSASGAAACRAKRDHPRTGGEKAFLSTSSTLLSGSPPHGRGKGFGDQVRAGDAGITPAWAGKSTPLNGW